MRITATPRRQPRDAARRRWMDSRRAARLRRRLALYRRCYGRACKELGKANARRITPTRDSLGVLPLREVRENRVWAMQNLNRLRANIGRLEAALLTITTAEA